MVFMTTRAQTVVLVVALALAASLLTLAVVLAKPAQAQAQTFTDTDQEPVSGYTSSCTNDELVFIEGTLLTVAHTTIDANGDLQDHTPGFGHDYGRPASQSVVPRHGKRPRGGHR